MRGLITGGFGQDGVLLSQLISEKHPEISLLLTSRNERVLSDSGANFVQLDLLKQFELLSVLESFKPDFIWHLAGVSSVADSWKSPGETISANSVITSNLLECVRIISPETKVVLAGSSEIFARGAYNANEKSPVRPSSPYGISKATNLELGRLYREVYGVSVSTALMFNHESNLRPPQFLSKSIAKQVASIALGKSKSLQINDPSVKKDWGWAEDFVRGLLDMAFMSESQDIVLATGRLTSVQDIAYSALDSVGLSRDFLKVTEGVDPRPNDSEHPWGDVSLAKRLLNWEPTLYAEEFIRDMVSFELSKEKFSN